MAQYIRLGQLIEKYRLEAGLAQQLTLATLIGSSQQTVSRWESGLSRPRVKQLGDLAAALNCAVEPLLEAAGYSPRGAVTSFAQPFPLYALSPENFERFCHYALNELYMSAKVHRVGGTGHTQKGADIQVAFPDGELLSFQCKRHSAFGAAKATDAISAHQTHATKKFLLLAGTASPAVREVAARYSDWDVWDAEDISLRIRRDLSTESQRRLVDTFFPGQRMSLLGLSESGAWQTIDEFFLPFQNPNAIFRHNWTLVGRETEVTNILKGLTSSPKYVTYLVGKGGGGKTRLLKTALEHFTVAHPNIRVWLLSPTAELTQTRLDELGHDEKLLVVDDAHDRTDLGVLFQHTAASIGKTRVLLSLRPYGLEMVKSQAVPFAMADNSATEVPLGEWTIENARRLSLAVMSGSGFNRMADQIAQLTADCPLATVVGSFLVAKEQIAPALLSQEPTFRVTLLGKFQSVLAGAIGSRGDADAVQRLLRIVSLVQPVYPEDPRFKALVQEAEDLKPADTARIFRLLADAGILVKRSGLFRVAPDLLADFNLERACVGISRASTGYAEEVFDHCQTPAQIEHLLLNLGRLDWRLANGKPSNGALLDGIWSRLNDTTHNDSTVKAVAAVAFYQPDRALNFLEAMLRSGTSVRGLSTIAKHAAYNYDQIDRACELLWALGCNDSKPLGPNPDHPIRVLSEMCAVAPDRPIEYNQKIVDFILTLTQRGDAWKAHYTPFDVLPSILHTEGHTTTATDLQVQFKPFLVRLEAVAPMRKKVVDRSIELLSATDLAIAAKAARFLQTAIRFPMGQFNSTVPPEVRSLWADEFAVTIDKINTAVDAGSLPDIVLIEIARSVSWHAAFAGGPTNESARRVMNALPTTLSFRTKLALVNAYGQIFADRDFERSQQRIQTHIATVAGDLRAALDGEPLRKHLEDCLREIDEAGSDLQRQSSPVLLSLLIEHSVPLASAIVENALRNPQSLTACGTHFALVKLMKEDRDTGVEKIEECIRSSETPLILAAARAYGAFQPDDDTYSERDISVLRGCLRMRDSYIVRTAINSTMQIARLQPRVAMSLLYLVDLAAGNDVADDLFLVLRMNVASQVQAPHDGHSETPLLHLTDRDIQHFLKRLTFLPTLDGYWTQTFLAFTSRYYPMYCLDFLLERLNHSIQNPKIFSSFRPVNYGPYIDVPLEFRKSDKFGVVVREVMNKISQLATPGDENYLAEIRAGELFEAVCSPFDNELMAYVTPWIATSSAFSLRLIAQVLSHASDQFVFEQKEFVSLFLDRSLSAGPDSLRTAMDALVNTTVSGVRSGIPGQPFAKDISLKERAERAMQEVPRLTPPFYLYAEIKTVAEQNIAMSERQREFLSN